MSYLYSFVFKYRHVSKSVLFKLQRTLQNIQWMRATEDSSQKPVLQLLVAWCWLPRRWATEWHLKMKMGKQYDFPAELLKSLLEGVKQNFRQCNIRHGTTQKEARNLTHRLSCTCTTSGALMLGFSGASCWKWLSQLSGSHETASLVSNMFPLLSVPQKLDAVDDLVQSVQRHLEFLYIKGESKCLLITRYDIPIISCCNGAHVSTTCSLI